MYAGGVKMGACYSVNLNITLRNETAAIKAMQEYIKKEQFHINFGLEDNRKRGIGNRYFC